MFSIFAKKNLSPNYLQKFGLEEYPVILGHCV